uniref:Zn(2)-C6 fungal-type domain-containing protein n=1 Tax=Moniliophthora roreri TaxID=221103 RepID=A0A0W0FX10_MONRR
MSPHAISTKPDDTQRKRRKGATRLSCAECRRLKLRCDRAIPCSSCIKRGCGAICPDGSLTTGQGNRFVLASTQELHEKIHELANRVRELEDALRVDHAQITNEQHPLLSEDLLKIKAPLQREVPALRNGAVKQEEESNPDVVDAFGSLSISMSGKTKYFGHIANSWLFLQNESGEDDEQDNHLAALQAVLPPEILKRASALPMSTTIPTGAETTSLQALHWYLPSAERAAELRAIYYRYAAWMYNPVSQEVFDFEIFNHFYGQQHPYGDDPQLPHRLSVLFMVLAIGCLMDSSLPPYNVDAEKYHQLAKAALFQNGFLDAPTISAVQALFLMTYYLFISDRHGTGNGARWATMGLAVKLSQSIGLHRDSGRWNGVDADETQRRRQLFWEIFTYDSWQCYTFGRPPSFALPHIDCKMPHATEPAEDQIFHAWKHRFVSECMNLLHDQAFGAKTPTYATVLQLDRKLRAFPVPPALQVAGFGSGESQSSSFSETVMITLQRHIVLAIREMNLLYLHRSFFARAISDHPKDPLGSPYGTSVIAAYRSAGSLVALMRNLHTQLKEPSERLWFLWTHMFSCAIVLGSIVTRCPSMSLAPSALVQLDSACELFSKAARGFRAIKVMNIMLQLQKRAHQNLEEFRQGNRSPPGRHGSMNEPLTPVDDDDELAILGGRTRLVKKEPSSPQILERSPVSHNPVVPLPLPRSQMDPNVLEYLSSFQSQSQPSSSTTTYSDGVDSISPVSMYGLTTLPGPSYPESGPFSQSIPQSQSTLPSQSSTNGHHLRHHSSQNMGMNGGSINGGSQSFPQYFPVYDYGSSSTINGYPQTPVLNTDPQPHLRRSSSGSPEQNSMNTTWQDFITHILFDCDNTLVLSEALAFEACAGLANEILDGQNIPDRYTGEQLIVEFVGQNFRGMLTSLQKKHGFELPGEEMERYVSLEEDRVIAKLKEKLVPCVGANEELEKLEKSGKYELAVVSSSAHRRVIASLEKAGQAQWFPSERVFSAATSLPKPTSKPDPAIYLHACKTLGVEPKNSVAVEDSKSGSLSAIRAGIPVIAYVGSYETPEKRKEMAKVLKELGAEVAMNDWTEFESCLQAIESKHT